MNQDTLSANSFAELISDKRILKALDQAGYEAPTPIQQQMIPHMSMGNDVIGQAQTGTGKTAAFSLPLIEKLDLSQKQPPQALIITPTRELALQVTEELKKYGTFLPKLHFATIFGGQDYSIQLKQLKRKPQVLIGTPGRLMDHIRKNTISLSNVSTLVLDEADEMLNMGFIEDIEWILEQMPAGKIQTALFSATMPKSIREIAQKYLSSPIEIKIKNKTATASTIHQRFLVTPAQKRKTEALMRILDGEITDGVLIFVRTKIQTVELAEKLSSHGLLCSPLNGDMPQNQRIRAVEQLKKGQINVLIATDVAARGLDVERVSHVINFDVPFDVESYIHRVGRTGRAGRQGEAILFIHPREKRMLKTISRVTKSDIKEMQLPSNKEIEQKRVQQFIGDIEQLLEKPDRLHKAYQELAYALLQNESIDPVDLIAVLSRMANKPTGLFLEPTKKDDRRQQASKKQKKTQEHRQNPRKQQKPEAGMERYRLEAGHNHDVKPSNIVGAIANEADIDSEYIGRISIYDDFSLVDLPYGMPHDTLRQLQRARINGVMMKLKRDGAKKEESRKKHSKPKVKAKRAKHSKKKHK